MKTLKNLMVFIAILPVVSACLEKGEKSDAYGNFEAREIIVSSEVQGKILKLMVEEGQILPANEVVGLVDTVQPYLKKEQLVAQKYAVSTKLNNIHAQINVQNEQKKILVKEKNRFENLLKDGAATTKQLDDIAGKINLINSQIESIRTQKSTVLSELTAINKQIEQIEDQIKRCKIINPIFGTVLEKYIEPHEIVIPGRAIYKIADLREMILRVYISGNQLSRISIGQKVEVLIDKNERETRVLEGTVSWISQQAEFTPKIIQTKEERVNLVYAVKVHMKNDGSLKIGMPGEVNFKNHE